ncbi:MAG: hypothetical protein E6X17_13185 [Sporomusaceae bacterium]|nr:hypothetical protein [Sporomusaceae bacterium]
MEMLLFYLAAIALSAYETNKSRQHYQNRAQIDLSEMRDWLEHADLPAACRRGAPPAPVRLGRDSLS